MTVIYRVEVEQTSLREQDWRSPASALEILAAGFAPISLKQMDDVALLNRTDTKFVMPIGQLLEALAALQPDYWILSINGRLLNHYRTLYFDTPGFTLYHAHVNGQAERYKVRSREYADTHQTYLEVKHKTRKDRTIKERIRTDVPVVEITPAITRWLDGVFPLNGIALEPVLWNTFTRMTLVSKQMRERVTLDIDLAFQTSVNRAGLGGIAIAEVKTAAGSRWSPFLAQMHAQSIRPHGFSKYSIGVSLLYSQVKKNALKPKMLWIEKMMKGLETND